MNSSDEAVEAAFWRAVEYARHAYDLTPYSKMSEDAWPNAVRAAWPIIAAAVRAEAVADERRRIEMASLPMEELPDWTELAEALDATLTNHEMGCSGEYETTMRLPDGRTVGYRDRLAIISGDAELEYAIATGSVPVATPEPDDQSRRDLIVCSHCLLTPAEIDATDHHSGGWCPGPVATPEPPTSCERCGHPVHDVGCLARPLVHGGTYTCGCGGPDDVRLVGAQPAEPKTRPVECICTVECPESDNPCFYCCALGYYDPCPVVGFGCGQGSVPQTVRCDCCTDEQWQAAAEVATPPARSVGDVLAADITGDLPPDRVVNTRPAPSQPVTCAHWKTESHVIDLAWPHKVWCPGPVSVPKESSE